MACTPWKQKLQLQKAPKRKKNDFEALFEGNFTKKDKKENHQLLNLLTNHHGNLDAATPFQFMTLSCKNQSYYGGSRSSEEPWCSHYRAICRDCIAKHKETTHSSAGNCSSKTGARPQREKEDDLEALCKRSFKRRTTSAKTEKICWQITIDYSTTLMQPLHYDSRLPAAKDNNITQTAAAARNLDAAITLRFAAPRTHPCNQYHAICIPALQNTTEEPITLETIQAATAAHTSCPSSPAAATLPKKHQKTPGFVLRLPPQHKSHATFMQPLQCVLQHLSQHFPKSPLPSVTTSLSHNFSYSHHFPYSHHFTKSTLPLVTTLPSSPLP